MTILRPVTLAHVANHAGIDIAAALGGAMPAGPFIHELVTPVATCGDDLAGSKFYRSIVDHVNDDPKKSNFSVLIHAIARSAMTQNYQALLKGSNIQVKPAYTFTHAKSSYKLWELKEGKKDRLYFFPLSASINSKSKQLIVLLLAYHKKDQTTPDDVCKYAEAVIKSCVPPNGSISICKE